MIFRKCENFSLCNLKNTNWNWHILPHTHLPNPLNTTLLWTLTPGPISMLIRLSRCGSLLPPPQPRLRDNTSRTSTQPSMIPNSSKLFNRLRLSCVGKKCWLGTSNPPFLSNASQTKTRNQNYVPSFYVKLLKIIKKEISDSNNKINVLFLYDHFTFAIHCLKGKFKNIQQDWNILFTLLIFYTV